MIRSVVLAYLSAGRSREVIRAVSAAEALLPSPAAMGGTCFPTPPDPPTSAALVLEPALGAGHSDE